MSSNKPIKVLSTELANQIAAGEVVERPASVVKELVENSLDAGATEVLVEIEQGGSKKILIRDNGNGIEKSQLELALSRHATSKIDNIHDLEKITSMGFRGEALASISSVSRLTLTSKPANQKEAWQAFAEGRQMDIVVKPAAHPNGTSIEVIDLFFNTPARRKFLKTPKTEYQHIEALLKRLALTNPHVKFSLFHNQKRCLNFLQVNDIRKRIEQVCSKSFMQECIPVNYEYDSIRLTGYASKLGKGQSTREHQYTFVNGRIMKDKLISHALRQAYEDTLPAQTFPAYVLYLSLPTDELDINVHPAKHEVRFHQSRQIHDIVYKAVTQSLGVSEVDELEQPQHDYIIPLQSQTRDLKEALQTDNKQAYTNTNNSAAHRDFSNTGSFRNTRPTKKEVLATRDFYASISTRALDDATEGVNASGGNAQPELHRDNSSDIQEPQNVGGRIIYSDPFILIKNSVTNKQGSIDLIHVGQLASLVIKQQIMLSTTSQPLLMPVSRPIETGDKELFDKQYDFFRKWNFEITLSHSKVILKKVPSGSRHLPWANIFGNLRVLYNFNKHPDTPQECLAEFTLDVANAWLKIITPSETQVASWLVNIDKLELEKLLKRNKVSIDLHQTWKQSQGEF